MSAETLGFFVAGLAILLAGAEFLVRGASRLASAARISKLVIGLTVVAFGTSAPELAVSVQSALAGEPDVAIGNVVGSNIFNVLFILGISAILVPLAVKKQLVRFDVPIMILVSGALWAVAWDGQVDRREGLTLAGGALLYTLFALWMGRQGQAPEGRAGPPKPEEDADPPGKPSYWPLSLLLMGLGLAMLVLGSRWLVTGAVELARALGVSELAIGLTLVSAGTSLPEVATSIVAAVKGERDIAVGNVVGSNIFNILCVLGVASAVAPDGIAVSPTALHFDIPVALAVAVACLPIFFTGYRISRWEGLLFFAYYGAYIAYLYFAAAEREKLPRFNDAMLYAVLPLTGFVLLVSLVRALSGKGKDAASAG
ncbi:MAG: calcium/sodium antiporter [Planctomycetes bacterium]|nr:calcium/sodium antiporter [Planctomycetota bacterium]